MTHDVLCIHGDGDVRARLTAALSAGARTSAATSVEEGLALHGRSPFDVVLVELDKGASGVRAVTDWHPVPAIVTVGDDGDAVELALANGAQDHVAVGVDADDLAVALQRAWRRQRAARTRAASRPPAVDLLDVRRRVAQLVSLTTAAAELLGIDEPPHLTVRSLLDQARELGEETVQLAGRATTGEAREALDLERLATGAWDARTDGGGELAIELPGDVDVHGHPSMVRAALAVLFAHALRGDRPGAIVRLDAEVGHGAVRVRVHDDGPPVDLAERRLRFVGDADHAHAALLTVEHVAARHGGTAWLADSDVLEGGTMAVLELPRRAPER